MHVSVVRFMFSVSLVSVVLFSQVKHAYCDTIEHKQCTSCGWIILPRNSVEPSLGLIYVHMRKAGGTAVLNLLQKWLYSKQCIPSILKRNRLLHGFYEGNYKNKNSSAVETIARCPNVDFRHNEFHCLSVDSPIRQLPSLRERKHITFSIFTVFRDPIARLVSQAFYSGYGVGNQVRRSLIEACVPSDFSHTFKVSGCSTNESVAFPVICDCIADTTKQTISILRSNETIWFDWYSRQSFGDGAMSNYYIKRLTNGYVSLVSAKGNAYSPSECFKHPNSSCRGNLLSTLGGSRKCNRHLRDVERSLEDAKTLLRDHFEFLVLERFSEVSSARALSRILREPSLSVTKELLSTHSNTGWARKSSNENSNSVINPEDVMPGSFLDFLKRENAADIALYKYVNEIFDSRSNLQWDE
mmetsp:Transcript_4886/g.7442  ORF Transcript_4886/g.7442 Transcript_4886/m.7442 type:complete len:413 (-) Transcript_4886:56-1294(-)